LVLLGILIFAILGAHTYGERLTNHYLDPIFWGNFSIILGFMSFASIQSKDHLLLKIYKFSGFVLGISMSLMSQSRAGWVAALIMALAWLALNRKELTFKKISLYVLLALIIPIVLYIFMDSFKLRIDIATIEFLQWLSNSHSISSTSTRLNMLAIGLDLVSLKPYLGYGNLKDFSSLIDTSTLSFIEKEALAMIGCCGPHNDAIGNLLKAGLFGFFAYLALYLIPFVIFLTHKNIQASGMGVMVVIGFFIAGFFTEMLGLKISYTFYAIITSGMLATVLWQKKQFNE
jgi:O-antigen ligase